MNSNASTQTPASVSCGGIVRITLWGYLPPTRNQLKGTHWSVLHREKARAAHALRNALESETSYFEYTANDQPIGMDTTLRSSKIVLSRLASWMTTHGMFSKGKSSHARHTRRVKSELKSKQHE